MVRNTCIAYTHIQNQQGAGCPLACLPACNGSIQTRILSCWGWKFILNSIENGAYVFHFVTKCLCSTCPTSMVYGIICVLFHFLKLKCLRFTTNFLLSVRFILPCILFQTIAHRINALPFSIPLSVLFNFSFSLFIRDFHT